MNCRFVPVEEMDQYLDYIGGPAGALALTGVAAASAFYLASRPTPQKPLVELDCQSRLLPTEDVCQGLHLVCTLYLPPNASFQTATLHSKKIFGL
ncbi:hypothetical protein L9F63_005219, partial [Diploptera punctata]